MAEAELEELQALAMARVEFINEGLLPLDELLAAETLLKDIDTKDTPFLALSNCLDAWLWTGDKVLSRGLRTKGYERVSAQQNSWRS